MNIKYVVVIIALIGSSPSCFSQKGSLTIDKPQVLTHLVSEKIKLDKERKHKEYKIQIYSGSREMINQVVVSFQNYLKEEQKSTKDKIDISEEIIFQTPNYKIQIGTFLTRLEADRWLFKIRKKFPESFIL